MLKFLFCPIICASSVRGGLKKFSISKKIVHIQFKHFILKGLIQFYYVNFKRQAQYV